MRACSMQVLERCGAVRTCSNGRCYKAGVLLIACQISHKSSVALSPLPDTQVAHLLRRLILHHLPASIWVQALKHHTG